MDSVIFALLVGGLANHPAIFSGQDPGLAEVGSLSESAEEKRIGEAIETFFANWKSGTAARNEPLLWPDADLMHLHRRHVPDGEDVVRREKAALILQRWEREPPSFLRLDQFHVDLLAETLATGRIQYTGAGIKGRAVLTFAKDKDQWKIASLVLETRFRW